MLYVASFVLVLISNVVSEEVIVETSVGKIKGLKADDGDYVMYMGIPYAKVNSSNPFGESIPHPSFENTYEAYDDSARCPQVNEYNNNNTIMGSLDCLQLNIYVPSSSSGNMAVMVWIHGGGFRFGQFGRYYYGPNYLVQHDVIVVTINYRTGVYGFMCLDIPEIPGNQGLKDQYLAFKWIKDNIKAFGGDVDRITVFGQSAGGHSIDLHLMSVKETLFDKIILQTGSAQALTMLFEPDKEALMKIASYLGFKTNDTKEALSYISYTDTHTVVAAATNLKIVFKPCVEKQFEGVEPFLVESFITAIPKIKNIPVLMGFDYLETADDVFPKDATYFENITIVKDGLKQAFNFTDEELNEMDDIVLNFYFGDEKMTEKLKLKLTRFSSDFTYIHPVHRTLSKYLENGADKIYFYMFTYIGARNAIITTTIDETGNHQCCASHGDEVGYILNTHNLPDLVDADKIIVKRMTTMWTNFAKYSEPIPQISDTLPVKWEPVTQDNYYYLDIGYKLTLGKRPLHKNMAFWDLFFKSNKKSQRDFS